MLQALARNHRTIAWFLVSLFYLQLVLVPVAARAGEARLPLAKHRYNTLWHAAAGIGSPVTNNTNSTGAPIIQKQQVQHPKAPVVVKGTFTTGPTQPEMQSFQSVNANNLVDLFSGDFSYNIPLLDVGGYPVNLHYQSGVTMEQEASWVGLGWNINPGVVSRNMRGLPDDFNGVDTVVKTASIKNNRTIGANVAGEIEIFGVDTKTFNLNLTASVGLFHNTYKGWGLERALSASVSVGIGSKGALTAGMSYSNNTQTGFDVSPSMGFVMGKNNTADATGSVTIGTNYNSRTGIQALQITGQLRASDNYNKTMLHSVGTGINAGISFAKPSYTPTIQMPYTSKQIVYSTKVGGEVSGLFPNVAIKGYWSEQEIEEGDKTQRMPAYGYLNYEKANGNQHVLLDFNREKDVAYSDNAANIAVPIYTYDTWSISGEGTGGMFRAYRSDIGYIYDHSIATKSSNLRLATEAGFGNVVHGGYDYSNAYSSTQSNAWTANNQLVNVIGFHQADTTFESAYFKNPGERTASNKIYHQAIGGDYLMRTDLTGSNDNVGASSTASLFQNSKLIGKSIFDANTLRKTRDKRNQVISYLTADQAAAAGLDKTIRSYYINNFPTATCNTNYETIARSSSYRKGHHISEITVLNNDGRRYVYGVPVYNTSQVDVTMSTQKGGNNSTGLVSYSGSDSTIRNTQGRDGYFNKERLPAYTHSFLLSGILSPDYVDLTGDGISEDDNGEAVKFNYSQVYTGSAFRWRAPYNEGQASYNEGLKSDDYDDKGSYSYGTREVWYLNSIESKTMIATFVLETSVVRKDGFGVKGENGGMDATQKLYRLKEINLYAKADYLKNGQNGAKPIKTVHFGYSYDLCKNNLSSTQDSGKLTLTRVWFTYNKNDKGVRNPYVFTYHSNNPDFNPKAVDRWGNYKNAASNPGTTGGPLVNADYPYTLQSGVNNWDSAHAADNAAPWTLSAIKLPSGGTIKVTYESDDYAYVQNKRAMQFFSVLGFGASATDGIHQQLYTPHTAGSDYYYVYVKVTDPVQTKDDITRKYLEGVTQLFFKLAVNMPQDNKGKGFELIPCYAEIDDYGVRSNNEIWIRVKAVDSQSPFALAAVQFLRMNLPSKAYPYSEPGDNIDLKTAVGLFTQVTLEVITAINGFNNQARKNNWCNSVVTDKSFIRLDNPVYKKLGGGLRVQKVEIYDHFNTMTGGQQQEANYGQTYDYTTEIMVNGQATRISSGVASYEPMIGADENPFHVPAKVYKEKVGALAPSNYLYVEEPFAETFFPAPSVGYSRVRVQTIHKDKKSANGFDETEFYTSKDFPTLVEYTPIDGDSKKSFNPKVNNLFNINARHFVTLSQGFKVELNDMNGKVKSQASYAQNDLQTPISYTFNYYRLQNDAAGQPKLSNTAPVVNSATGVIDTTGEIGKDIEIMVDVREQTSTTQSLEVGLNVDMIWPLPPITIGTVIPIPSAETNRYRAVAILKIINRYGLLDSVLHIEKGSRVTTRDLVYDGETGECLVSQTNNEFDDPVYNFNYPAHWAYTGMQPAYKNIGTLLKNINFRRGIAYLANGTRLAADRYFESGDEILVYGNDKRTSSTNEPCDASYYQFSDTAAYNKIWAIDASLGKEKQKGIYFIDKDGIAYSGNISQLQIIRSGKRNLAGVAVGAITSMASPIRTVNDTVRLVFDANSRVIAASAARFKDRWKVDSTVYAKDTQVIGDRYMSLTPARLLEEDNYAIHDYSSDGSNRALGALPDFKYFEASAYDNGKTSWDEQIISWLKFNMSNIPKGSVITSATINLFGSAVNPHANFRDSNSCYLERLTAAWPRTAIGANPQGDILSEYFYDNNLTTHETQTRVLDRYSPHGTYDVGNDVLDIQPMAQAMLDQYYNSDGVVSPGLRIRLVTPGDGIGQLSRLCYNTTQTQNECTVLESVSNCVPYIELSYYPGCRDGSAPVNEFHGTYKCHDELVDSVICKSTINDTAVNFYRVGILGNWRMDRAYTYYGARKQTDPTVAATNTRTDGEINSFAPYWSFSNALLSPSSDTTRWVWNSEMTLFNNKGSEIENHDPLNRYNAGQYGYNKTLPVAVAQNARNREIAFDGFEDYYYTTNSCQHCVFNRHATFTDGLNLVDTVSHSGLYSLAVPGNTTWSAKFDISSLAPDSVTPVLSMKEDSTPLLRPVSVTGNGQGLTVRYATSQNNYSVLNYTSNIDYYRYEKPIPGAQAENFWVKWHGYIQPRYSGTYTFYTTADDLLTLSINNVQIQNPAVATIPHEWTTAYASTPVYLEAGSLYDIEVNAQQGDGSYQFLLQWESQGTVPQSKEYVPASVLYAEGSDTNAIKASTIVYDTTWCVQFKNPTGAGLINNRFAPVQGKKVVVSTWVKQQGDCVTGTYNSARLQLVFNDAAASTFILKPSGNIIDGWQRIEDTLTVPPTATQCTLNMQSVFSVNSFFDDLRIHPFNGNMKSFVYNPVNLRLMAELDENNYATFYEYDDDGTLIRVKKETEQGVKTIKETRSALLKE
jgi:hypothetical protein